MDMKHNQRFSILHQPLAQKELFIIFIRVLLLCFFILFSYIFGYSVVGDFSFLNFIVVRAFLVSLVKFFFPCAFTLASTFLF